MAVARQYNQDTQINHGTSASANIKMTDVMPIQHTDVSSNVNQIHKINFAQTMCEPYAVCNSNNPANGAYTATCSNFPDFALSYLDSQGQTQTLVGMKIRVMFTYGVSYGSVSGGTYPTLNINGSGAIPLLAQGKTMAKGAISAGQTVEFTVIPYGNGLAYDADTNVREKTADYTIYVDGTKRVDSVTSGGTDMVTSRAIYSAIDKVKDIMGSLPTDAVLHYSFDEVPDYPDGTATLRQMEFSDTSGWTAPSGITLTVENNSLKIQGDGQRYALLATNNALNSANLKGKVVKLKVYSPNNINNCYIQEQRNTSYPIYLLSKISQSGNEYIFAGIMPNDIIATSYLNFGYASQSLADYVLLEQIYIGDGSYSTPIIDNANGQNNATNYGGIAVKGVSGKGVYFPNVYKNAVIPTTKLPAPTSNDDFSISVWVKIANDYVQDGELITPIVSIGHYAGTIGITKLSDKIEFIIRYATSGSDVLLEKAVTMKKGEWHLYTMVYDGTTHIYKAYEDSKLLYTSNPAPANYQFGSGDSNWYIYGSVGVTGTNLGSSNKNSSLDDLLIFDRALTETEVMALYLNKANTPKYYPPVPLPE